MLPSIIEIANQHNLILKPQRGGSKEVLGKCPFCRADEGKRGKYYLSLNVKDQVFRCWYCGEKGGVFRFESLLTGIPESEITDKYRISSRKSIHPALKLSTRQLQLIGFSEKPNWVQMRTQDKGYYERTRDWIWTEWCAFVQEEKEKAFVILLVSIFTHQYTKGVHTIQKREREIDHPLLDELCKMFSLSRWPEWAIEAKRFAMHLANPTANPYVLSEKDREELYIDEIVRELVMKDGFDFDLVYNQVNQIFAQVKNLSKPAGQYQLPAAQ
ncbi:hypothetical protein [Brevibacillus marinus]|uniref:hypothetical protein n=1 Tax=Brevibacillus marinus TaxID=2496837 RepID=UPI000F821FD0|nr:hypothetical protein [Brevibacillus marinus]